MKFTLTILMVLICSWSQAQYNFDILRGRREIRIPFEVDNNFIVVELTLNKILPLRFIFDTGAEHTILNKKELADALGMRFERQFKLVGADLKSQLTAFLTRNVHVRVGDAIFPYMDMLVLQDDYLQIEEYTGTPIHGILGADFFKRFVVKIDYQRQELTLQNYSNFRPPKKFEEFPVQLHRHKPYIYTDVQLLPGSPPIPVKLLLDTGASLALMIHTETSPSLKRPENVITGKVGMGIGGIIEGFIGRMQSCCVGPTCFSNVITNFQTLNPQQDTSFLNGRNGLMGSILLQRFVIYIDYVGGRLFLRPGKRAQRRFRFDRSGLGIIASGEKLDEFIVQQVLNGSPSAESGVQVGDKILRINGLPARMITLPGIVRRLQKKRSKKIKLTIEREGQIHKLQFRLRDLI